MNQNQQIAGAEWRGTLQKSLTGHPDELVKKHLQLIDPEYLTEFSIPDIDFHLSLLEKLKEGARCRLSLRSRPDEMVAVTFVGVDKPGVFSILTGLLTTRGFDIQSGSIFTYRNAPDYPAYFVDVLNGRFSTAVDLPALESELQDEIASLVSQLFQNRASEARQALREKLARFFQKHPINESKLYPLNITSHTERAYTVLHVTGESTPGFLYTLTHAFWSQNLTLKKIIIETEQDRVDDIFYLQTRSEKPLTNQDSVDRLKSLVALIKHFTHFLPSAPDPQLALNQFEQYIDQNLGGSFSAEQLLRTSGDSPLAALARAFGSGEYLWEEFIKLQSEALLPFLRKINRVKWAKPKSRLESELLNDLSDRKTFEEKVESLNRFKDRELFRIDLSYLIYPHKTFIDFSRELTDLAEVTINAATHLVRDHLVEAHGKPRLEDGSLCRFGVFALGKFGGRELGYASDLEILVLYEGTGETDSDTGRISNAEFFNGLVRLFQKHIHAKKSGIFELDLRLRPHGPDGPPASSMKAWRRYFQKTGQAHDFERQALIKLRSIYGEQQFLQQVMQLRDEMIYGPDVVGIDKVLTLREKQLKELVKPGQTNAKYSPGGLCEIEYGIQFLQLRHGREHPRLRTPNTIEAMEILLELEVLGPTEFEKLYNCTAFLRRLINGLRLVRGHAKDLLLPAAGHKEFAYLARRLGYQDTPESSAEKQLKKDLAYSFKNVHAFFRSRFIEASGPPAFEPGLAEVLSGKAGDEAALATLSSWNLRDLPQAIARLKNLYARTRDKPSLLAVLAMCGRHLQKSPDPETTLINLEKYVLNPQVAPNILKQMLYHPKYIEIATAVFGYGDFLANILNQYPYFIHYIANHSSVAHEKSKDTMSSEIEDLFREAQPEAFLNHLRIYHQREILRIGMRDIYFKVPLETVTQEISNLADAILEQAYRLQFRDEEALGESQCVLVLGKLGGRELNYSSDVDLVFVRDDSITPEAVDSLHKRDLHFIQALSASSDYGSLYRVDTDLKPYGKQGNLTSTYGSCLKYYREKADPWELQAWLKARVVCGGKARGEDLIREVHQIMLQKVASDAGRSNLQQVRLKTLKTYNPETLYWNVKQSPGGIRTLEFFTQQLQILHGNDHPELLHGNTLWALGALHKLEKISPAQYRLLRRAYVFFRKAEHALQLENMQQRHVIPAEPQKLESLARRSGFHARPGESPGTQFLLKYRGHVLEVLQVSEKMFPGSAHFVRIPEAP